MNRRTCINCETEWRSLAEHELDAPHTCPSCGDQLVADNVSLLRPATARTQVSDLAA